MTARRGYFVGDLDLHEMAGHHGQWFCLLCDLTYVDVDPKTGAERWHWTAVAGSLTNFGNIPRPFWSIWPTYGKHTRAVVIHDDLCVRRPIRSRDVHDSFKRMLEACRCSRLTVWAMWQAVRKGGPRFTGPALPA